MRRVSAVIGILMILSVGLLLSSCGSDDEPTVDVAGMLVKDAPNLSIEEKEPEVGCKYDNPACNEHADCINNECVTKQGCAHDNPPCDENQTCSDNICKLKTGCSYNNPGCKSGLTCIDNACVYAVGCNWDNPPCDDSHECKNNECVPKPGCANDNPPCPWGQICMDNECVGTATGTLGHVEQNNHWGDMQTVEEAGIDLGTQKD